MRFSTILFSRIASAKVHIFLLSLVFFLQIIFFRSHHQYLELPIIKGFYANREEKNNSRLSKNY